MRLLVLLLLLVGWWIWSAGWWVGVSFVQIQCGVAGKQAALHAEETCQYCGSHDESPGDDADAFRSVSGDSQESPRLCNPACNDIVMVTLLGQIINGRCFCCCSYLFCIQLIWSVMKCEGLI